MQLRMSPGGRMRFSRRRRPELPPSSVTVTIAARSTMGRTTEACSSERRTTCSFSPRRRVERPVPPPRATTRKPGEIFFDLDEVFFTIQISGKPSTASLEKRTLNGGHGEHKVHTEDSRQAYLQNRVQSNKSAG